MEEQVKNTVLDLGKCTAEEAAPIVKGFELFCNGIGKRYFGYVDKDVLKDLNAEFGYTDLKSFGKGAATALGVTGVIAGIVAVAKKK